jgi:predicted O-methyltransferase YrrM
VGDAIEIVVGPALETLPRIEGPFDLVFIDADKQSSADYLALALDKVRPGALIVVDNVVRGGALADPADDDPRVAGARRVVEAIAAEPRLLATGLQTVGAKGWDGMLLALVGQPPLGSKLPGCL